MINKKELKEQQLKHVHGGGSETGMCPNEKLALTSCKTCAKCSNMQKGNLNDAKTHYECYCTILEKSGWIHISNFN